MPVKRVDLNFPYLQYLEIKASLIFMANPVNKVQVSTLFKGLVSLCLNSLLISKNIIVDDCLQICLSGWAFRAVVLSVSFCFVPILLINEAHRSLNFQQTQMPVCL